MIPVPPGLLVVFSDIGCPWAHACVARLHRHRRRLGLEGLVRFDHRCFPLELVNSRPTPKRVLDAEVPVVGGMDPDAGWQVWQRPDSQWPVTTLPAMEAVQSVKEVQDRAAAEALDRALRVAFFGESRCISMRSVVLDVARETGVVDVAALADAWDEGVGRRAVIADWRSVALEDSPVQGSPHVFAPGGLDAANPGVQMHWEGEEGSGFPVVDGDDQAIYDTLLAAAAG